MRFSIKKHEMINYSPEELRNFNLISYEWIDNLNFTLKPEDCLNNPKEYITIAKELFLKGGWDGDGEIELMWVPPFMIENDFPDFSYNGFVLWHVKQKEDGISWILSPIKLLN
jgi:hypothetical protein